MKKSVAIFSLAALLASSACTADLGTNTYYASSAGEVNTAKACRVVNVRPVTVKSNNNGMGTLFGAAAGGVAGYAIGGGDTAHNLGAIGGALAGGIAGNAAQGQLSKQTGFEYVVRLDNGNLATIVQGNDVIIQPGERCMVLYGKQAKVVPYNGY